MITQPLIQLKYKLSPVRKKIINFNCLNSFNDEKILAKNKKSINGSNYDASQITVLEGLEPVRRRPGVFIGSTGIKGLHHLVSEIIDNSIDESLAGYCDEVNLSINSDTSVTAAMIFLSVPGEKTLT